MKDYLKFYIDGQWVDPAEKKTLDVINPATEEPFARISMGSAKDVDKAVAAAKAAFPKFSTTTKQERIELLQSIMAVYQKRYAEIAAAITEEMGAPQKLSQNAQAAMGIAHLNTNLEILKKYEFEEDKGPTRILREPVGVCAFITPWNWPINQIALKVVPALAVGCTMVLKPSEVAPINAYIFAEVLHEAGVPKGVFNLVNGDGVGVGSPLSAHPDVDMVSFTGSTRAGIHRFEGGRRHGQARRARTRRQVGQHRARRCRLQEGGGGLGVRHDVEFRPELQRAVAHAGSGVAAGRGDRNRQSRRRAGEGGRSERRGHGDRPGRFGSAVPEGSGPDPEGHRRKARRSSPAVRAVRKASTRAITCARRSSPTSPTT